MTFVFCFQFTWLPNEIGVYDLIVMSCLHRLSNPKGNAFSLDVFKRAASISNVGNEFLHQ